MPIPKIQYMRWAKTFIDERPAEYSLASSGLEAASPADIGLDPPIVLPIGGANGFGHPVLKRAVAAHYRVDQARVLLAQGTSLANYLVLASLLERGQVALCEWPCYEPLHAVLTGLGARIVWIERPRARGFAPDLDAIAKGFARGARVLVLSDLHNPSAALLDARARAEIVRLAERHEAFVVVDEVYLSGVFDRAVASAASLGSDRVAITASLTKTFGLGGLRCGWAIAPPALVERASELNDHFGVEAAYLADEAAVRAFERLPHLAARARARRDDNLPLVRAFAAAAGLALAEPAGGFIAWLGLPDGMAAWDLATRAREQHGVQVVPGDFFGDPRSIRVGFGGPRHAVEEGLRRLAAALG